MAEAGEDKIKRVIAAEHQFAGPVGKIKRHDQHDIAKQLEPVVDWCLNPRAFFPDCAAESSEQLAQKTDRASPAAE